VRTFKARLLLTKEGNSSSPFRKEPALSLPKGRVREGFGVGINYFWDKPRVIEGGRVGIDIFEGLARGWIPVPVSSTGQASRE
jgi:hypothetical protein